jgi:hypothetical protein
VLSRLKGVRSVELQVSWLHTEGMFVEFIDRSATLTMLKRICKAFLITALGSLLIFSAWIGVISTDLRFLPIFHHFELGNTLASDQQELLRHLPVGTSLGDVQSVMQRNGFSCRNIRKGQHYDTGYIYKGVGEPISDRDFLACYVDRMGLPCRITRRVEVEHQEEKLTRLAVYGDHVCL